MDTVMDMAGAAARGGACAKQGDAAKIRAKTKRKTGITALREFMIILVPPGGRIETRCSERLRTGK
jgi:hypothetical protein